MFKLLSSTERLSGLMILYRYAKKEDISPYRTKLSEIIMDNEMLLTASSENPFS